MAAFAVGLFPPAFGCASGAPHVEPGTKPWWNARAWPGAPSATAMVRMSTALRIAPPEQVDLHRRMAPAAALYGRAGPLDCSPMGILDGMDGSAEEHLPPPSRPAPR